MVEDHPPGREAHGEDHFNDEVDKGWEVTDALTELPPRGAAGLPREGGGGIVDLTKGINFTHPPGGG